MDVAYDTGAPDRVFQPRLYPVYLIWGEEDYLKDEVARTITARAQTPDFADFDTDILHASSTSPDAILASAAQCPFGSERRLVIVRGAERWRAKGKTADLERLAGGIANAAENWCLVLIVAAGEDEARRKTALSPKLDGVVNQVGALVRCAALKGPRLTEWVSSRASSAGKQIERTATARLIDTVGSSMRLLDAEIAKLAAFSGSEARITVAHVEAVSAATPEDVYFRTVDAVARRSPERSLLGLTELQRHEPNSQALAGRLLSLLARQYRLIWQAKLLEESGVRSPRSVPERVAELLPSEPSIARTFRPEELFEEARMFTWQELTEAMELLAACDLANKGGEPISANAFGADVGGNLRVLIAQLAA